MMEMDFASPRGRETVTVVIPCFNAERTLRRALDSVFAQTFDHWKIIAVDDGSADATSEILRAYHLEHREKIIPLTSDNKGACHARNLGVSSASTQLVALLDSDDYWEEEKLERQVEFLARNPNIVGVTTGFRQVHENTGKISKNLSFDWSPDALREWALLGRKAPALNSTLVVRASAFRSIGGFDETLVSFAEDLDLSWRLVGEGPLESLSECLVTVSITSRQNHRNTEGMSEALKVFFRKISSTDPELARRAEENLAIYEALSGFRAGKLVKGLSELVYIFLSYPSSIGRFIGLRLFGLGSQNRWETARRNALRSFRSGGAPQP
jgi:glycosyltransferase involved in cell wall biosynthesis